MKSLSPANLGPAVCLGSLTWRRRVQAVLLPEEDEVQVVLGADSGRQTWVSVSLSVCKCA